MLNGSKIINKIGLSFKALQDALDTYPEGHSEAKKIQMQMNKYAEKRKNMQNRIKNYGENTKKNG
jgi:hypothetical protein